MTGHRISRKRTEYTVSFFIRYLLFFSKKTEASLLYRPHRLLLSLGPGVNHIKYLAPSRKTAYILIVNEDIGVYLSGCILRPFLFRIVTVDGIKFNAVCTAVFNGFVKFLSLF